jgi:methylenetetrahydrofolate dehydrogenase (NADP+) / methenyltetrahydrofolate cyclohydrolase
VLVGNDPASELYVKLKQRAAVNAGIGFTLTRLSADVDHETVLKAIDAFNLSAEIDAVLVQLPLPRGLHEDAVVAHIDPEKDADGFHPVNTARFLSNERTEPPALIEGIMRLVIAARADLNGLVSAIVARESVFSACLAHELKKRGASVVHALPDSKHHNATIAADIVIVAAGQQKLITGIDLKPGAIVIDVGINSLPDGKVIGDVDTTSATEIAGWITPVPGGVGPMTIAMLLENVVRLAERNEA